MDERRKSVNSESDGNDAGRCESAGERPEDTTVVSWVVAMDGLGKVGDIPEPSLGKVGDIPEPSHRLLRGPCTLNNPAFVTGIQRPHTSHTARLADCWLVDWVASLTTVLSCVERSLVVLWLFISAMWIFG